MRLLFVCTGNQCRSPLAERLTAAWAGPLREALAVGSAGTAARVGAPMHPLSEAALTRRGGDAADFRSQPLTRRLVEEADLVLTMTEAQRQYVLGTAPRALRRTFTVPEASDLLTRAELDGLERLSVDQRARELAVRLNTARAGRLSKESDDVPDPLGHPAEFHETVAEQISRSLAPLVTCLLGADLDAPTHRHAGATGRA